MSCDVGEETERLENEQSSDHRRPWIMGGSTGDVSEEPVT